jgi:hypothetical protein
MMAAEILVFLGLIYLLILQDGAVDDSREIRCTGCGHTRRGPESGVNLLAWFGTFSNVFDRCPECGGIYLHVVERTENQG